MDTIKNFNSTAPQLKTYEEIIAMDFYDAKDELNLYSEEYYNSFLASDNIYTYNGAPCLGINGNGLYDWTSGTVMSAPNKRAVYLLYNASGYGSSGPIWEPPMG